MNPALLRHFFRFYDGRFDDPLFIATAFNQLERHACVRQTARIGATSMKQLEELGKLANSPKFRQQLIWDNPHSSQAKKINARVSRILSMVGSAVPFSLFERSATRSKIAALRLRFGLASYFLTGAPPEFEALDVIRHALIQNWNAAACPLSSSGFERFRAPRTTMDVTVDDVKAKVADNMA
ncbi:hypothetical protein SDRG_05832 [Saprolegnia diclina VS20]|uniref:Uncharacterized protein n=1 Tax=Saprolegnia diclina (strain VS20) TaxID=1156394 RepID=T0QSQ0_SAPDV|nr:hypothetical protein SDRG_05832 [Saprolegnia diclina VS20]EQC37015.1 hypothetical protein SDRG_05832 [Saprolegnia diclina VS20]|eukprot:XP_008609796.1 hypothetical protein SDRG_05832 [Saprolegnia diclina VS20]